MFQALSLKYLHILLSQCDPPPPLLPSTFQLRKPFLTSPGPPRPRWCVPLLVCSRVYFPHHCADHTASFPHLPLLRKSPGRDCDFFDLAGKCPTLSTERINPGNEPKLKLGAVSLFFICSLPLITLVIVPGPPPTPPRPLHFASVSVHFGRQLPHKGNQRSGSASKEGRDAVHGQDGGRPSAATSLHPLREEACVM